MRDGFGGSARGRSVRRKWNSFPPSSSLSALLLLLTLLYAPTTHAQGAFFRSLLSIPDECAHDGVLGTCSFVLSCLIDGGRSLQFCGGGFLYTCCAKPQVSVRSDISNEIGSGRFNFFGGSTSSRDEFRPKTRFFGRGSANELDQSHLFEWPPKYIPVRKNVIPTKFLPPPSHAHHPRRKKIQYYRPPNQQHTYYNQPECGIQHITERQFSKRIIGGHEAQFAELPWQAHIRISGYQCGGVLLNEFFVATAAHCVHKARLDQITVYLGEYDTKDTGNHFEPFPEESFQVVEKKTHPSFKYMLTQPDRFDVAVLRLSRPVPFRENIVPICLPDPSDDFLGDIGIVAGWGKTDTSFGKTGTNILRKVTVPVITNEECLRWHHRKAIDVKLHFEMFCAGHSQGTMDACLGDSGGPLVIFHRGRWRLAGITSAGFGCAVDHQPGIYHKISVTAGWIAANIVP